jgi:hypothetical protein
MEKVSKYKKTYNKACSRKILRLVQAEKRYGENKCRKYGIKYVLLGFIDTDVDVEERPQYLLCPKILTAKGMKSNRFKRNLETMRAECV